MATQSLPLDTGHPHTRFIKDYNYSFGMDSQTEIFRYLNHQEHSSTTSSSVSPLVDGAKKSKASLIKWRV